MCFWNQGVYFKNKKVTQWQTKERKNNGVILRKEIISETKMKYNTAEYLRRYNTRIVYNIIKITNSDTHMSQL